MTVKNRDHLLEKAKTLPTKSGCYMMLNQRKEIVYIGKAKNLKNRVTSYFNSSAKAPKTITMLGHVVDFEFILTKSDSESYILENNLIKEHSPKYNIRLRDDKSYPYVQVNLEEDFPMLEYTRRPKEGKNRKILGPYPSGSNLGNVLRELTKAFQLRDCSKHEFNNRKKPCLLHQIHQCSAPCVGLVTKDDYHQQVEYALEVLQGKKGAKSALELLEAKMQQLAEQEQFEHAAIVRDQLKVIEDFLMQSFKQEVEFLGDEKNVDVINYHVGEQEIDISIYLVRNGLLLGQRNYFFFKSDLIQEITDEIFDTVMRIYLNFNEILPDVVVSPFKQKYKEMERLFQRVNQKKIRCHGGGDKLKKMLTVVQEHAIESQRVRSENQRSVYIGLAKLQELMKLAESPRHLECYDIAIWQGKSPTASRVVFIDGKPDKKLYRYYHLEERAEGNNDFAMIAEVVQRRVEKGRLPDLFIIDGGKGQVNIFQRVLKENDIDVPVVGIAKSRVEDTSFRSDSVSRSEERLIIPNRMNPYLLSKCMPLYRLMVQMRDEAHRFSRKLHHKQEAKRVFDSWIDDINGIGDVTKKKLLQKLDTPLESLKKMNVESLMKYFNISEVMAQKIFDYLND